MGMTRNKILLHKISSLIDQKEKEQTTGSERTIDTVEGKIAHLRDKGSYSPSRSEGPRCTRSAKGEEQEQVGGGTGGYK